MCMIDGCDERFTLYNQPRLVRARKEHKCDECHRKIASGESYYSASGLFESEFSCYYICAHCWVACQWLQKNCGGFLHMGVFEDVDEHVSEYNYTPSARGLQRIKIGMQRHWRVERGARVGQLMAIPRVPEPLKEADFS